MVWRGKKDKLTVSRIRFLTFSLWIPLVNEAKQTLINSNGNLRERVRVSGETGRTRRQ